MTLLWLVPVVLVAIGVALAAKGLQERRAIVAARASAASTRSELIAALNEQIKLHDELDAAQAELAAVRKEREACERERIRLENELRLARMDLERGGPGWRQS